VKYSKVKTLEIQSMISRKKCEQTPILTVRWICPQDLTSTVVAPAVLHFNLGCYASLLGDVGEAKRRIEIACKMDKSLQKDAIDDPRSQGDVAFFFTLREVSTTAGCVAI
jgi:hypothetical protein